MAKRGTYMLPGPLSRGTYASFQHSPLPLKSCFLKSFTLCFEEFEFGFRMVTVLPHPNPPPSPSSLNKLLRGGGMREQPSQCAFAAPKFKIQPQHSKKKTQAVYCIETAGIRVIQCALHVVCSDVLTHSSNPSRGFRCLNKCYKRPFPSLFKYRNYR